MYDAPLSGTLLSGMRRYKGCCDTSSKGDIRSGLHFHPVILYTVILYLWFMISNTIQIASKGKIAIGLKYRNLYVYIALVIRTIKLDI